MEDINFNNISFTLYQILPDYRKIMFLNEIFDKDLNSISQKFYEEHFKDIINSDGVVDIEILSFLTPEGDKVNIFFHDDYIHVNCDRLKPIKDLVKVIFTDGNIIFRDKSLKKTKENRTRYHMRFYRAYKKLNEDDNFLPIILS